MVWKSRSNDVPLLQAQAVDHVEPVAHQSRVAGRIDAATVFGEEGSLGDDVEAGEEGQALVEDGAHDMAVACTAEELQRQAAIARRTPAGIIFEPGKPQRARIVSRSAETRYGRNRNRPPNLVRKCRGDRSSWRTSAASATVGRG